MADFPATRWSLIARLPGAPQEAAALLALYADAVTGYLRGKLRGEPAERIDDVVQEALLALLARPAALSRAQPGGRFRHFLMHLAWQAAIDRLRHLRRHEHVPVEAEPVAPDQEPAMDAAWARAVLAEALAELRQAAEDGRIEAEAEAVLRAHLIDGRDLRAIAGATGLSLATCSRRLAAARRFVQHAIGERLRLAGELAAEDDEQAAGARLIALLAG
jgi:RNA polymerase sigma factor (sigma-70 family)